MCSSPFAVANDFAAGRAKFLRGAVKKFFSSLLFPKILWIILAWFCRKPPGGYHWGMDYCFRPNVSSLIQLFKHIVFLKWFKVQTLTSLSCILKFLEPTNGQLRGCSGKSNLPFCLKKEKVVALSDTRARGCECNTSGDFATISHACHLH